MTNPFLPILKEDQQKSISQTLLIFLLFSIIVVAVEREAFTVLFFSYLASIFYIDSLLKRIALKQKMLMVLPGSSTQLVQAVFTNMFRYIGCLKVGIIPFFMLIALVEETKSSAGEYVVLYVLMMCITFLTCAVFVWLYFTLKHRPWLTLLQYVSLVLIAIISVNISFVFETLAVPIVVQLLFFLVVYGVAIYVLYSRSLKDYRNFNLLS